jgi:hypothetical protein
VMFGEDLYKKYWCFLYPALLRISSFSNHLSVKEQFVPNRCAIAAFATHRPDAFSMIQEVTVQTSGASHLPRLRWV